MRELDINLEGHRVVKFIRDYFQRNGFHTAVIGISGGIDSAVSAALTAEALGKDNVLGLMLPYRTSHPDSLNDALTLAKTLGIKHEVIDISPMTDAYFNAYSNDADPLRRGNWMARTRMCVLFDYAAKLSALVIGTSNRSELLTGYCTQYGDSACAIEPIGHLYKTEVRRLATKLGVPETIITKTPTADLWEGQTDEAELGMSYAQLDEILYELTELHVNHEAGGKFSFPLEAYRRVDKLIRNSAFKRTMPPILD